MKIEELYKNFGIDYITEEDSHKHARPNWVNCACPFCIGNPGYHLGWDLIQNKYFCWRCGGSNKFPDLVISKVLNISQYKAKELIQQYGGSAVAKKRKKDLTKKEFQLPSLSKPLTVSHIKYLKGRGFDAEKLVKDWKILGTSQYSVIDKIDYSRRIVIPFYWDNEIVSFDTRDITNRHKYKYRACPKEREIIEHKAILYGRQEYWGTTGICVEGPTDVWRMGFHSFAVSGIEYKPKQIRQMANHFKRIAVVFDDDPQAVQQARKLVSDLKFRGVDAFRVDIEGDPGGMSQKEADYLVKQIIN